MEMFFLLERFYSACIRLYYMVRHEYQSISALKRIKSQSEQQNYKFSREVCQRPLLKPQRYVHSTHRRFLRM